MTDWQRYAERVVEERYGDGISISARGNMARRHGRVTLTSGVETDVTQLQSPEVAETYLAANTIDRIVSDKPADTQPIVIQGLYLDGSNDLVAHQQVATLTGQTPVALSQPLARVERAYVQTQTFASPATPLTGIVSVFDNAASGGTTGGIPNTAAATHLLIEGPTWQESQKAAVSVPAGQYAFIAQMACTVERGGAASNVGVDFYVLRRNQGGVWRSTCMNVSLNTQNDTHAAIDVVPWVPMVPNDDIRVVATAGGAGIPVLCTLGVVYAEILR